MINYPELLDGLVNLPPLPADAKPANSIEEWFLHDPDGEIVHNEITNNDSIFLPRSTLEPEWMTIGYENQGCFSLSISTNDRAYDPIVFQERDEDEYPQSLVLSFSQYLQAIAIKMKACVWWKTHIFTTKVLDTNISHKEFTPLPTGSIDSGMVEHRYKSKWGYVLYERFTESTKFTASVTAPTDAYLEIIKEKVYPLLKCPS